MKIHVRNRRVHITHAKKVKDVKRGGSISHVPSNSSHNSNLEKLRSSLQKLSLNANKVMSAKRRFIKI